MGLGPKFSVPGGTKLGEPQAHRYRIFRVEQIRDSVVALIQYPDASEYDGMKLLVYRNLTVGELESAEKLDPHFLESSDFPRPFARFEPTHEGLLAAFSLAENF